MFLRLCTWITWVRALGIAPVSTGVVDGVGDVNLSVRVDFGDDNSNCGEPICDALNTSCLAKVPKLQLELCQSLGSMSVEYVTTPTEQVSNYFQSNDCTGSSISSESVLQGACTPRSSDKEARQYFPLVGVCNNASTAAFLQRYISETPLYGSAEEFPTDVCLSNGEAESKVYSIHEEKVFRVTYGNNNCTGSAESVNDITSRASIFGVFCLDFATVNIDWNLVAGQSELSGMTGDW
ncbi:unnamed protein product [Durusdinium trenchii]|uniref:Uncharacterized protein n=1 Tax=Durusdinium trenchii TaxID=1381693 RepID=A0ABP0N8D9_9DINO